MDNAKRFFGIYIAFLLQSLLFENIKILSCSPDILLVAVIMCSVSSEYIPAAAMGAFAGFLSDALYARVFGINILIYMYLALLVSIAVDKKNDNSPLIMGWICFVCTAAFEIVIVFLKAMLGYSSSMKLLGTNIFVKGVFCAAFSFLFVIAKQFMIKRRINKQSCAKEENA